MDMSVDHKPEDDLERNRIEKAGGRVTADGRVNGGLNLSRAIGNKYLRLKNIKDNITNNWLVEGPCLYMCVSINDARKCNTISKPILT